MIETTTLIYCLVVEDNAAAIDVLKELIAQIPFLRLVGVCHSATEAVSFLHINQKVDLIFSDIEMEGVDGLGLAKMLRGRYQFILISGHRKEHAVDAFELGVVDYIWKPVTMDRLLQALVAYQDRMHVETWKRTGAPATGAGKELPAESTSGPLLVHDGRRVVKLQYRDILYIRSNRYYISYHLVSGKPIDEYRPLREIEELLESSGFWRTHNSYIVNSVHVVEIARNRNELVLSNGEALPISRSHAKKLAGQFNDWQTRP